MLKIILILSAFLVSGDIYDYSFRDINGNDIPLRNFEGKKILLVNIASESKYAEQLSSLEKLHMRFENNLVIIAFPSNSFGHETGDNSSIKSRIGSRFSGNLFLAEKVTVSADGQNALFSWLTQKSRNGMLSNEVKSDFYKYLIDETGKLIGVFNQSVDPMSEDILSAIGNN